MKTVRITAALLYYVSKILASLVLLTLVYALVLILIHEGNPSVSIPFQLMEDGTFQILFPFTKNIFLLGDYTPSYLVSNLTTIAFYGIFLWMLGDVFHAFKQVKIFTRKGVIQLSRFYLVNLIVPFIFLGLLAIFGQELMDLVRIILLHLVIGIFAFFMAAIFRQGLILQEEQDLTF